MPLGDVIPAEIRQMQKDEYCMIPCIWGTWKNAMPRDRKWNGGQRELGRAGSESEGGTQEGENVLERDGHDVCTMTRMH